MLQARGETILYISKHGPFEKGKDIISRAPDGRVHAYQLKKGDIGLADWRDIRGEIEELVELAIEIPGAPPITEFVPYLVTNGELKDTVIEQIRVGNLSRSSRGIRNELLTVGKGELFAMFREAHGAYLPRELTDFQSFLELITLDGASPADKGKAALLFEHLLPADFASVSQLDARRAATSVALLAAYISGPAEFASNHWSRFEYWVLAGSYVLYCAENSGASESSCESVFSLCEMAAEDALAALARECEEREDFVQGLPLDDGHVYRARMTIIIGTICALDLSNRIRGNPRHSAQIARRLLTDRLKETIFWGESATPFYWASMLATEQDCNSALAESVAIRLIRDICELNGDSAQARGFPNPYYSAEESLRLAYGLDPLNDEQFVGFSYSVLILVHFLVKRLRRQALARLWHGLTRMGLVEYAPARAADWYRWKTNEGVLNSQLVDEPQSWEKLMRDAKEVPVGQLPRTLLARPAFALWYALVYPHRFTRAIAKLIDDAVAGQLLSP